MSLIKWQVLQWAGRMVKYATLSRLSDRFGFGYVDSPPIDPEAGEERTQQRVRFLQWFGFRSRPKVSGGEAIVVAPRGGATNAVAVAADNLGVGPTDLLEGESVMYGSGGSTLKHDQPGKVSINAGGTSDVVVNGGTLKVARVTDQVGSGVITSQVATPSAGTNIVSLAYTDADGATYLLLNLTFVMGLLTAATPPGPTPAPVRGRITGPGADRFKA